MSKSFRCFSSALPVALAIALPVALVPQSSAWALSFRFDFDDSVSDDFQQATQEAANTWSSVLKDDVVVDLRVEYSDLSEAGAVLAGVRPDKVKVKYEDYVQAMLKDAVSQNDIQALGSLQLSSKGQEALQEFQVGSLSSSKKIKLDSKEFNFLMDGQFAKGVSNQPDFVDDNGSSNNKSIILTRAQAQALDLVDDKKRGLDGIIKINSDINWDTNSGDGIDSDKYDLSTVMKHEIAHALGVISGVDGLDFLKAVNEPVDIEKNEISYLTPLDLFRYSEKSTGLGVMDATLGGDEKYFSLDAGQSAVTDAAGRAAYFSTGSTEAGGDGYSGSHWKAGSGSALGVINPILQKGTSVDISELDSTLLDTIGWDLEDNNLKRAAAIGLDWTGLTSDLASDREAVKDQIIAEWGDDIPALDAALSEASFETEEKFRQKLQEEFDKLTEELEGKDSDKDRQKKIGEFYEKVGEEAGKRNEKLQKLPKEISETDDEVREWLASSTEDLSEEMREADGATINRLANIVKAAPRSERSRLEDKVESALAQFVAEPSKLVKELLKSKDSSNPIRWGRAYRFNYWWQKVDPAELDAETSEEPVVEFSGSDIPSNPIRWGRAYRMTYWWQKADPAELGAEMSEGADSLTQDVIDGLVPVGAGALSAGDFEGSNREAEDVPEPSSVLALFGIAVLGAKLSGRGRERR